MRRVAAITLAFLAWTNSAQAVTLIAPGGRPVGGVWQRWANEARIPTYPGRIVLVTHDIDAACGGPALGCMYPPNCATVLPDFAACPWRGWTPEVVAGDRWSFEHELGHVFDYRYLTTALRHRLLPLLGERGHPWFLNEDADDAFANTYAWCAEDYGTSLNDGWPSYGAQLTSAQDLTTTCRLIAKIG